MTSYTFDGILFDNDGVLVDSEAIYISVERELLAELGLFYDYATYLSRFVGLPMPDYYQALARDYADRIGGAFPSDFAATLTQRVTPRMDAELNALPNVDAVINRFDGPVAVASSMSLDIIHRKLELVNLSGFFNPHVYSGEQVEKGKPAPDLFLFVAERLGLIPENCLVIEDSVNGVMAGVAAKMTVFGFVGGSHADPGLGARLQKAGAEKVFFNHAEIADVISPKSDLRRS